MPKLKYNFCSLTMKYNERHRWPSAHLIVFAPTAICIDLKIDNNNIPQHTTREQFFAEKKAKMILDR